MEAEHLMSSINPGFCSIEDFVIGNNDADFFSSSYQDRDIDPARDFSSIPVNYSFTSIALPDAFSGHEMLTPEMINSFPQQTMTKERSSSLTVSTTSS